MPTKAEQKRYIQDTIHKLGVCSSIKTSDSNFFVFLTDLFKHHPAYDTKCKNMTDIKIRRNPQFKNYELCVVRSDGTYEDISYNICLGKNRSPLLRALRESISPQILEYRATHHMKCAVCHTNNNIDIDHIYPFEKLVKEFKSKFPTPTQFGNGNGNQKVFLPLDIDYEREWIEYHRQHAILQPLCSKCNGEKSNKF